MTGKPLTRETVEKLFADGEIDREHYDALIYMIEWREEQEREEFAALTVAFDHTEMPREYPMPLECHPAYTDKQQWIVGWLDDPYPGYAHDHLRIPVPTKIRTLWTDDMYPTAASLPVELLTRKRCAALAPWTEQPFHYEWWVAVDSHNRWVAADARIVRELSRHADA